MPRTPSCRPTRYAPSHPTHNTLNHMAAFACHYPAAEGKPSRFAHTPRVFASPVSGPPCWQVGESNLAPSSEWMPTEGGSDSSSSPLHLAHSGVLQVGGKILFATDEWFAAASDVIKVISRPAPGYSCPPHPHDDHRRHAGGLHRAHNPRRLRWHRGGHHAGCSCSHSCRDTHAKPPSDCTPRGADLAP